VHSNPSSQAVGWKAAHAGEWVGRRPRRLSVEIGRPRRGGLRVGDLGQTARLGGDAARHIVQHQAGAVGKTARSNSPVDHGHDPLREPGS
jgi:hypothetical protein